LNHGHGGYTTKHNAELGIIGRPPTSVNQFVLIRIVGNQPPEAPPLCVAHLSLFLQSDRDGNRPLQPCVGNDIDSEEPISSNFAWHAGNEEIPWRSMRVSW
jgi:hypothetical protein